MGEAEAPAMLKGCRRTELKVVWGQPPSEEALAAFSDGLAELIAADLLRGDASLLSERIGNELQVGLKSTSKRADGM